MCWFGWTRVVDLAWLAAAVADLCSDGFGRPGIDPEVAVRLMLAGFLQGIVHDRRLRRDCQSAGIVSAGIVSGDVVHLDVEPLERRRHCLSDQWRDNGYSECQWRGLIRADVGLGSLAARHMDAVDPANPDEDDRLSRNTGKFKKICVTDPDASRQCRAVAIVSRTNGATMATPSDNGDGDKLRRAAASAVLQAAYFGR